MLTGQARARLLLSLVVESGDPRLRPWLDRAEPVELWRAVARGDHEVPRRWHEEAAEAERALDTVLRRGEGSGARWIVPGMSVWPVGLDDLDQVEGIGQVVGAPLGLWVRGGGDLGAIAAAPVRRSR